MDEKMDVQMTRADATRLGRIMRDTDPDIAAAIIDALVPGYYWEGPEATVFVSLTPGQMAYVIVSLLRA